MPGFMDYYNEALAKQGQWSPSTPEERACVSESISEKIKEGWERAQAIAAAHSICRKKFEEAKKAASEKPEDRILTAVTGLMTCPT